MRKQSGMKTPRIVPPAGYQQDILVVEFLGSVTRPLVVKHCRGVSNIITSALHDPRFHR